MPEAAPADRGRRSRGKGLRVPKASELIARRLRRHIQDERLAPGDALPSETDLRAQFEVSRPTLREALRILEAQQLVRVARGATGGARYSLPEIGMVAEHTGIYLEAHRTTQKDLTEARLTIEPVVIRYIAEHAATGQLGPLKDSLKRHREAKSDIVRFSREHERFYALLAELCPNRTLAVQLLIFREIMAAQTSLLGEEIMASGERTEAALEGHIRAKETLVDLFAARDGAAAEDLWRRHLDAQLRQLVRSGRGGLLVQTY
jgi:DNA-binding FadR family transcriptional regulator